MFRFFDLVQKVLRLSYPPPLHRSDRTGRGHKTLWVSEFTPTVTFNTESEIKDNRTASL